MTNGVGRGSEPLLPSEFGRGGQSIWAPRLFTGGTPVSGPESRFNIFGAPIAVLGGVFSGGLPIGGPVSQIFRGGSAPMPPTLFIATISPSGPIGAFFIGSGGGPIGVAAFGGGGLPIGPSEEVQRAIAQLQPRTALVGASPAVGVPPPAVAFGGARAAGAAPPIGGPV